MNYAEITGELALMVSLTLAVKKKIKKGRLHNLLTRLQDHCEREFKNFPPLSTEQIDELNKKIISFSENCGWEDEVETIIFVSFLLGLIEESEYFYPRKIIDELNNIYDFITAGDDFSKHCKLADHALEVWTAYDKVSMNAEPTKIQMFVHRFKDSHTKLRKMLRKERKNGNVSLVRQNKDGWLYEVPQELGVHIKKECKK